MAILTRRTLFRLTAVSLSAAAVASAPATQAAFVPHTAVKALITARQTAVCHIADQDGIQTLLLIVNGNPTEAHARRNGLYQTKDLRRSRSAKAITPVDFNRLIALAGGLNQGVNGTPRAADFFNLYNALSSAPATPDPCPRDFSQRSKAERALIRRDLGLSENRRYAPCFTLGSNAVRLDFADDPFFDAWTFERDVQGHFYGLSLPGLQAIWSLEP
ncbi:hypothetical protein [Asticcacaulis sp. AND118]|uniref:hypothetical protein n=1 Tax=Asticcacaulis sp. AND118 TaxID=2840468 RepID=UPI001D0012A3|nr:hypothetical protein [Asticcacaulis sp. AND118]UDF05724.1 hypothetical protein LH365_17955 [Asticcacaulis sp. AND118]